MLLLSGPAVTALSGLAHRGGNDVSDRKHSRGIRPIVALTILDTLRILDRPTEFLRQEDPAVTLPRRLGLSTVIQSQIDRYEQAVRTKEQLREDEVGNLIALVLRREDAPVVLRTVGERLASDLFSVRTWHTLWPRKLRRWQGRRQVGGALRDLFGDLDGKSDGGGLLLSSTDHFFIRAAPDGGACETVTGFARHALERVAGEPWEAEHTSCVGRGDTACEWTVDPGEPSPREP